MEIVSLVEAGGGVVLSLVECNEDVVFTSVEDGGGLFLSSLEPDEAEMSSG